MSLSTVWHPMDELPMREGFYLVAGQTFFGKKCVFSVVEYSSRNKYNEVIWGRCDKPMSKVYWTELPDAPEDLVTNNC